MPIYDYRCATCGAQFEALVRASATPACPQCGGTTLERQVSAPVAPGQSKAIIAAGRRAAAAEGHMSNYSKSERSKLLR